MDQGAADLVSHDRTFMYYHCIIFLSLALQGLHLSRDAWQCTQSVDRDLELSRKAVSIDGRTDGRTRDKNICLAMLARSGRPHD